MVRLAQRSRLPAIYSLHEFARAGGLISYGTSFHQTLQRVAAYVDRIITRTDWPPVKERVGLPIEAPRRLELVINVRTANALGLTIPPSLLRRADQTI